ncbi:MAG: hypothetical protein Q4C54_02165 [Clostridia bacterium]|nr:hypothetical protein [Clostridia bacterium]
MVSKVLSMVLPVLVMILLGRYCASSGILNDDRHAGLKGIIGDILLPVVLFNAFFTAEYSASLVLVFGLVFAGFCVALGLAFLLKRFVSPYGRFMPLLMSGAEGGMLGYALFSLISGGVTSHYAMVDIGQTVFAYTVYLATLKAAEGQSLKPAQIVKNMVTNRACIGMTLGIVLGATGCYKAIAGTDFGNVITSLISFITAPTSALILIVVGYELRFSKKLMKPVFTTIAMRLVVMAGIMAAVSAVLFAIIPYDKMLFLALLVQYSLPAPFIIPLFADLGDDSEYVSTTLSMGTLVTVVLFAAIAVFSLA